MPVYDPRELIKNQECLKKNYIKLLDKYRKLRSLMMSLNSKLLQYFDNETDDDRF
tara:strand:+ start:97 stop:261 length:165 start_codon:yes stop_codon:yes gene_type:complete